MSACCDQPYENPSTPLCVSAWPDQTTSTVGSFDHASTEWLGLASVGLVGGVPSILNGPRWTAALQLPTASTVRRWNHQDPSASATLVAVVAVVSFVASGEVVELCDHSTE